MSVHLLLQALTSGEEAPGGGGGDPEIVQFKSGVSTEQNVSGIAFDVAPSSGNDVLLFVMSGSYMDTVASGWTEAEKTASGGAWLGQNTWYRKLSSALNSYSYSLNASGNSTWILVEVTNLASSPYDTSNKQNQNSGGSGYSSPSITPTAGKRIVFAAIGAGRPSGDVSGDSTGWTNGFTLLESAGHVSATGDRHHLSVGYLIDDFDGSTSISTACTWPFSSPDMEGSHIIALKGA